MMRLIQKKKKKMMMMMMTMKMTLMMLLSCMLMLQGEANVNAVDKNKRTPLHYAVQSCENTIIDLLLGRGESFTHLKSVLQDSPCIHLKYTNAESIS